MLFDTRVQKSIVNRSDYKGDNKFTCGITTKSGRIAMEQLDYIKSLVKDEQLLICMQMLVKSQ